MGIIDFLKQKKEANNTEEHRVEPEIEVVEPKKEFVPNLSFVELQGADWRKFAGMLKRDGVLSNSYEKTPTSIDYSLGKDNSVVVELTFKSATSDSIRKVKLFKDKAYLTVNGAIEMYPETQRNKDLNVLWLSFQNSIRYRNMQNLNREGYAHYRRGKVLKHTAEKMIKMFNVYNCEQEFLEKYQDTIFDGFDYCDIFERDQEGNSSYIGELPGFVPLERTKTGEVVSGAPVIPFSPRTLEHCILHMTNGQRIEDGEYVDDFEEKCRKIQQYSCFESDNWDKVINFGKGLVKSEYQASIIDEEPTMN